MRQTSPVGSGKSVVKGKDSPKSKNAESPEKAPGNSQSQSSFNFFWAKALFTSEPVWYRIVVIGLIIIGHAFVFLILHDSAFSVLVVQALSKIKLEGLIGWLRSKS